MEAYGPEVLPPEDEDRGDLLQADDFDYDWVRQVSIEDDAGFIHEFDLPGRGIPSEVLHARIVAAFRSGALRQTPAVREPETLADMAVMMVLGFWAFIVVNLVFFASDVPRRLLRWCVYSLIEGRCVADFG